MPNLTSFNPFRSLSRWDPMQDFRDLYREMQNRMPFVNADLTPTIKLDVAETDQAYTVKAEIPGVNKEDIEVAIDGNQVSISAEVKKEKEEKGKNSVYTERCYGRQFRSFSLESDVDDAKASAAYKDGVLELTLPKKAGNGRKKLAVQ